MAEGYPNNEQQAEKRIIGFDCEFVEPPPERYVQSECPVCLQIIRDPHQVTCCGMKFCKACIEHNIAIQKPCPACNEEFSSFADKGLKQSLYSLKVHCSHQKDGCEWTGELRQLDKHLNTDPQPEKRFEGCQFVEINCICNCGDQLQRRYILNHKIKNCPKRPFGCEHCHYYKSTYDDVTNNHWPVCGSFPVPCPNQCGSTIQRQNLDSHVADECPLTIIKCDFHHVGCAVKLPRQDMPEHLRENLLTHISLLAASHAKQQSKTTQQREEITKQQADIASLIEENKQLRMKHTELAPLQQMLTVNSEPLGAPILTMTDFQQRKRDDDEWFSPPVYNHYQGYRICLGVYANGKNTGKGTHVTVGVCLMRGEFDNSLKWPFRGVISFQLLDQVNGKDHKTDTINYSDKASDKHCNRVTKGEISPSAVVSTKFIAHTELEPKYLRNDTLLFQIHKVELN